MPRVLRPARAGDVAQALAQRRSADMRLLVKHYLALLQQRAPGNSVEVRVPPFAVVQVIEGVRHTRGTPPAVIETDPETWVALATGEVSWAQAQEAGTVIASGERADLTQLLPLDGTAAGLYQPN